jgi:hypothetical protein
MEKSNERKPDKLFAPSLEEAKNMEDSVRKYSGVWWLRNPANYYDAYVVSPDGNMYVSSYASNPSSLFRASFLLNEETYSGKELKRGDEIELPLKDGQKAKFVYACDYIFPGHVDGEKFMLAADDVLSKKTGYGENDSKYETSELRKIIQEMERLLTPEALEIMKPVEVRGNNVVMQTPVWENVRAALDKLGKKEETAKGVDHTRENIKVKL